MIICIERKIIALLLLRKWKLFLKEERVNLNLSSSMNMLIEVHFIDQINKNYLYLILTTYTYIILKILYYLIDTDRDPVPVMDFPEYVKHLHNNQDYLFSKEFSVR